MYKNWYIVHNIEYFKICNLILNTVLYAEYLTEHGGTKFGC